MKTWCIDFENEELGISVDAKTKEQATEIAENPCNWKDGEEEKSKEEQNQMELMKMNYIITNLY